MPSTADNIFLITGDDEPVIKSEAEKLVQQLAGDDPDPFALDVFREQDALPIADLLRQVMVSLKSPPFLSGRKTVWLQHFGGFAAEGTASSKTPDAKAFRELAELIKAGLPSDMALVMDGPKADGKKALTKTCKKHAKLIVCSKPNVRDRRWQASMASLIDEQAKSKGINLPATVCQHLVGVIGTDTAAIDSELEKLICFCGGVDQPITLAAAEEVCIGQGEEISWALTDALGKRDPAESLRVITVLLSQAEGDAERASRGLLWQVANFYRHLLQMRLFMGQGKINPRSIRSALDNMSNEDRQNFLADGLEVAGLNPYRAQLLAESAMRYSGQELIDAVCALRDAYQRCVTSSVSVRVLLEECVLRLTAKTRR
ncbi:MAG: DNA polymerase III subunit delta [Victivallales bacterium]|nr:DNA polymerase III subunit delta [Victivallales bacterium]MBT7304878.1 DNA polymerase III subunit delta [Victivallales bacterium]